MDKYTDESVIARLLDGDLTDEERRLLENRLKGSREDLLRFRRLIKVRNVLHDLPAAKCPVDMVSRVRARRSEFDDRCEANKKMFGAAVLRLATVAAVLALVFFLVFEAPSAHRRSVAPANITAVNPESGTFATPGSAMKVSTFAYDIVDRGYQPELSTEVGGMKVSVSRRFPNSITFHMTDPQTEPGKLRDILRDANLPVQFMVGYGKPVYKMKNVSAASLALFVSKLRKLDSELRVDPAIEKLIADKSGDLVEAYFIIRVISK